MRSCNVGVEATTRSFCLEKPHGHGKVLPSYDGSKEHPDAPELRPIDLEVTSGRKNNADRWVSHLRDNAARWSERVEDDTESTMTTSTMSMGMGNRP